MLLNWQVLVIALAAIVGGVGYAFFGWLESGENFNPRHFFSSVGVALFTGIGFGVGYHFADTFSFTDLLLAFLSGAGVTAGGAKVVGGILKRQVKA